MIVPNQPDASVFSIDPKTGESGSEVGRGQVEISGEGLKSKGYVVRKNGFESVVIFLPDGSGDNQLAVRMNEVDSEVAKRLAQSQAELENLRKTLALEVEKSKNAAAAAEKVLDSAVRAQHFITLGNAQSAKLAIEQIESASGGSASVPAAIDVLRAKERILAGDKAGALSALDSALSKSSGQPEAVRLRNAMQQ
jgi:hypothetical protein